MKRIYLLIVVALAMVLAGCGTSGQSEGSDTSPPADTSTSSGGASSGSGVEVTPTYPSEPGAITVGSADFPESTIIANIYADAMAAKGVDVSKKLNIGERPAYMKALQDGSIGFIPEYSGSILVYLDSSATAKTPDDVYAALQAAAGGQGLAALRYAAAQDADTITVTQQTAEKYGLKTIADLKDVASELTFGAPAQFKTRADGIPALKSVYGVVFGDFTPLQAGGTITVNALKSGSVDAADIFSTDPAIAKNDFVSLQDPKSMFAGQNVVPLAAKDKLTEPMVQACDAVSAKLDTAALASMLQKVTDGADPDAVAKQWLADNGLT